MIGRRAKEHVEPQLNTDTIDGKKQAGMASVLGPFGVHLWLRILFSLCLSDSVTDFALGRIACVRR